jgi:hypothetical protein
MAASAYTVTAGETYAQTGSLSKALGKGVAAGVAAYVAASATASLPGAGESVQAGNTFAAGYASAIEAGESTLSSIGAGLEAGMRGMSQALASAGTSMSTALSYAGSMALAGAIQGFGGALAGGESFKDAFKAGITQGVLAGASTLISVGGSKLINEAFMSSEDKLLMEVSHAYYAEENIVQGEEILGGLANINYGVMQDSSFFDKVGGLISKKLLNMNSVTEFVNQSQEAKFARKLARLESDFAEFNNAYKSYMDVLNTLKSQLTSTVTAEYVAKMQASIGKMITQFPDVLGHLDPDEFIQFATTSDIPTACVSSVGTFVYDKLTIPGYAPEMCFYDQQYLAWAVNGED